MIHRTGGQVKIREETEENQLKSRREIFHRKESKDSNKLDYRKPTQKVIRGPKPTLLNKIFLDMEKNPRS